MLSHIIPTIVKCETFDLDTQITIAESMSDPTTLRLMFFLPFNKELLDPCDFEYIGYNGVFEDYKWAFRPCLFQTDWITIDKSNIMEDHLVLSKDLHSLPKAINFIEFVNKLGTHINEEICKLMIPHDTFHTCTPNSKLRIMFSPSIKNMVKNREMLKDTVSALFTFNFLITKKVESWDKSCSSTPGAQTFTTSLYMTDLQINNDDNNDKGEEDSNKKIIITI